MVDRLTTSEESLYGFDKVLSYRTAHTAIRYFDDFFSRFFYEVSIDASRAVLILDDGYLASLSIADDVIQ